MTRASIWAARLGLLLACLASPLGAHPLAPALLDLHETEPGRIEVLWRTSVAQSGGVAVAPKLPVQCRIQGEATSALENNEALVRRWQLQCPSGQGLAGQTIAVEGLAESRITVILRLQAFGRAPISQLLSADVPSIQLPATGSGPGVMAQYFALGIEHLLLGLDHLLFVVGLFLLLQGWRQRLLTLTAFTLGHSLTLALSVLGWLRWPQAVAELGIAISLLWLALELARGAPATQRSWMGQRPALMATAFGLLHGLGFAGALAAIGLPQGELPLALLAFNLGIEAGQILVVLALGTSLWLWQRSGSARPLPAWAARLPVYALGIAAGQWFWARLLGLLG